MHVLSEEEVAACSRKKPRSHIAETFWQAVLSSELEKVSPTTQSTQVVSLLIVPA